MTHRTQKPQGNGAALRLLFLILLTAVFCTTGAVFFSRMQDTAQQTLDAAPTAIPDALIYSRIPFTEDETNALRTLGDIRIMPCTVASDTESRTFLLCAAEDAESAYSLLAGRLPQNGNECVLLSQDGGTTPIGTTCYLTVTAGNTREMTVVGLAQNARTVFSPYRTDDGTETNEFFSYPILYTVDDGSIGGELLSLIRAKGVSERKMKRKIAAYADEHTETASTMPIVTSVPEAETISPEILRERIRRQNEEAAAELAALDQKIAEAEEKLLALSEQLEEKRQAFTAEMEKMEHLSTNQTSLIPQKEEAEAEFAVMEAEISAQKKTLDALLSERDSIICTAYPYAFEDYNVYDAKISVILPTEDLKWQGGYRSDPALGYTGFCAKILRESTPFLLIGGILLLLTAGAAYLYGRRGNGVGRPLFFSLCAVSSLLGALPGTFLFPPMRMQHAFPDFSAWHTMTLHLPTTVPLLLLCAMLCAAVPMLTFYAAGRRKF